MPALAFSNFLENVHLLLRLLTAKKGFGAPQMVLVVYTVSRKEEEILNP